LIDLYYTKDIDVELDYRGCEFKVNISYSYAPPSGFSGEPQEHEIEIGWYKHPSTGKALSKRLQNEIDKYDGDRIIDLIIERETQW
tara:strand:+ start:967 stop:1224 length:258 start_codon:yes stop_codon:yes gene_type:complete